MTSNKNSSLFVLVTVKQTPSIAIESFASTGSPFAAAQTIRKRAPPSESRSFATTWPRYATMPLNIVPAQGAAEHDIVAQTLRAIESQSWIQRAEVDAGQHRNGAFAPQ